MPFRKKSENVLNVKKQITSDASARRKQLKSLV